MSLWVGVLVPGGRLVAAVSGPPEADSWVTPARRAVTEPLDLPTAPPRRPALFAMRARGIADRAPGRAGLEDMGATGVGLDRNWPSAEAYKVFEQSNPRSHAWGTT